MVSVAIHERDLNLVEPDPKVIEQPAGRADGAPRTDESAADGQDRFARADPRSSLFVGLRGRLFLL
ncbi:MAG TPA: hypothetical protein VKA51_13980, partial [Rubrobacteraceae bacterium]|nr:hypothetical protein [Rubrobacteraceae bacterium]